MLYQSNLITLNSHLAIKLTSLKSSTEKVQHSTQLVAHIQIFFILVNKKRKLIRLDRFLVILIWTVFQTPSQLSGPSLKLDLNFYFYFMFVCV
jgi:hypothetical protein